MNTTGQNGDRVGYRVILLLVVGLTAFSSAMNELNQLQQFTVDATRLIAQVSDKVVPAQVPQIPQTPEIQHTAVKVETCDIKQSLPSVELPWLSNVVRATAPAPRAVVPRPSQVIDFKKSLPKPGEIQIAKLKKFHQIDIDPVQFEVRIMTDHDTEPDVPVTSELSVTPVKTKALRHRDIRINPREREMLLKSLNRSINVRIAG